MASLNEDLKKTAEKQKEDLAMLEKSREKQSAALKETEARLKELQESAKVQEDPVQSSFLDVSGDADFLAPLRKAAAEAKAFAEKIRKESHSSSTSSSFVETAGGEEDYASKAERSLAMARQALSKLDADLASQKRELETQLAKAEKEEEALREGAPSFLQTEAKQQYDPLSPQALAEWREKFNAQLQRAREAAGITTPFKSSSLVQLSDTSSSDEKLKEDEEKVARLQEAFNTQMAKLKEDNAAMLAEAQAQIEKAKTMKTKLEADLRAGSSFLQASDDATSHHHFNAEAEKEKILALQRKWQAEAAQLSAPSQPSEAEKQLMHLIEEQKTKQATAQAELERLKQKLHKDIEALHKDISVSALSTQQPSFLQETVAAQIKQDDDEDSDDDMDDANLELANFDDMDNSSFLETNMDFFEAARELIEQIKHFATTEEEAASGVDTPSVAESAEVSDEAEIPEVAEAKSANTNVEVTQPEAKAEEEKAVAVEADVEVKEEPKAEILAEVEEVASTTPSFVELSSKDAADSALARAEEGLKKLQEKLRQQSANLASYSVNI
jgi:hypothetical protein